jgi:acetyl/propionyl-CoA carboxylase alpha subunit
VIAMPESVAARAITRLLIANRGEIARRVIRTCDALGVETVAVFSDPDRGAPYVDEATFAVALGGRTSAESYLDADKVLEAARRAGADAVHPGYGFLSENADFAQAVIDAGLAWVGPTPGSMRAMALKVEAKRIAAAAGVPLVPGAELSGDVTDADLVATGEQVGFPLLVKASAGGGGKGMRVVRSSQDLVEAVAGARREASASFGDPTVFLERYLDGSRHVEVQVFGDTHGHVVHLFERECSVQRRHQKIVEESPSPGATPATLERMYSSAVALAAEIGYVGAGTVEFLVAGDGDAQEFFFLEMNTRLQVEHPVTEMITGLDLVAWQLSVAQGQPLPLQQNDIRRSGHAIEVRLYAEDPARDFLPSTGTIASWDVAAEDGEWLRVDSGFEQGGVVSPYYDPMLAKIVARGDDRVDLASALAGYLRNLPVLGVTTNALSLAAILEHPAFLAGDTPTSFLVDHPEVLAPRVPADVRDRQLTIAAAALFAAGEAWRNVTGVPETVRVAYRDGSRDVVALLGHSWSRAGGRLFVVADVEAAAADGGPVTDPHAAQLLVPASDQGAASAHVLARDAVRLERIDQRGDIAAAPASADGPDEPSNGDGFAECRVEIDGVRSTVFVRLAPSDPSENVTVDSDGWLTTFRVLPLGSGAGHDATGGAPTAPVPGTVTHVAVGVGDVVEAGAALVVLEAMKMEHTIRADTAGTVTALHVTVGQSVEAHTIVVTLTPVVDSSGTEGRRE